MRQSQKLKLLSIWLKLQTSNPERWFFPYEFIQHDGVFIGYKAPTRFSELCVDYPGLIESKMDGKYRIGRLRLDNQVGWNVTDDLKSFLDSELNRLGYGRVKQQLLDGLTTPNENS